jgi:transcriptional regulator with XRE-family HTH domain
MPRRAEPPADALSAHLRGRVRELRGERGWSLDEMSSASGVSRSMLSQIERGRVNPTIAVAFRIARAFGLSLAELVETPGATSSMNVIRGADHAYHFRSDENCRIRTLSPLHFEKDVEFYQIELEPRGALRSAPHFGGTREYLTVAKGRVRVESAGDSEVLGPGDSAAYRADVAHAIVNLSAKAAVVYLVDIYR